MRWLLRVTGAGLLAASAAIHLDLYLTGYRTIPAIGWLFLLQVIAAFALAAAIMLAPLLARATRPAADAALAAAGAGFALATLGGYLLSLWTGLFGFHEVRTTAGIVAGVLEVAAFAALAALAALTADLLWPGGLGRASLPPVAAVAVAAFAVLGLSAATASGGAPARATGGATVLRTTTIGGVLVLTNASGRTLYWFAPDTSAHSACYGTCAAYWPPVTGSPVARSGVPPGKLGTIGRGDGSRQVTYGGHPLYTYIGDTGPGQASGNNLNLNGGLWHEMTVTPASSGPAGT